MFLYLYKCFNKKKVILTYGNYMRSRFAITTQRNIFTTLGGGDMGKKIVAEVMERAKRKTSRSLVFHTYVHKRI